MDKIKDEICGDIFLNEGGIGEEPFVEDFDAVRWVDVCIHAGCIEFK